tara:strand:- start:1033 stop:2394 length:1362 start_codon:yes stop_codon:yes gene_type:complete
MSCIISAPSTDSGKTTLSLLISCWASSKNLRLQTFKVGPDFLDQEQLSSIGQPTCRNLDIFLSGENWIKNTFYKHSNKCDLSLVEGAMGLFDGLGSTHCSSTANVAKVLSLPIIFIINAKGQVGSLLPLLKGFQDLDKTIKIKGVVFNNVNTDRHKKLIREVFQNIPIKILGFLPFDERLNLTRSNLGLIPPQELEKKINVEYFAQFAQKHLDLFVLSNLLKPLKKEISSPININLKKSLIKKPIAIAEDRIFHFQYPETKEYLEEIGIPLISWNIYEDKEIPEDANLLIIPGGFPERFAFEISNSKRSLNSLKKFYKEKFIYAECGGMMLLGDSIEDENGFSYDMAGILPFKSKKGALSVGYRYIKGKENSTLLKKNQEIKGHEFHYWQLENNPKYFKDNTCSVKSPWRIKSWGTDYKEEGWSNNNLHASWIHLHLPSNIEVLENIIINNQK